MEVRVLGQTAVVAQGASLDLGAPKQRAVVAALALHAGRPVDVDTLARLVWGDAVPTAPKASLQSYVTRLRRAPALPLVTSSRGYRLDLPAAALDATRLGAAVTSARRALGRSAAEGLLPLPDVPLARAGELLALLDEVLALWAGTPYADLPDEPEVLAERARLEELRLAAVEDRALLRLLTGDAASAVADLEPLVPAHPLREGLRALHALALTRAGRQAAALATLRDLRAVLRDELGIDPGPAVQALEVAVLQQAPELFATPSPAPSSPAPSSPPPSSPGPDEPQPGVAGRWPLVGREAELAALDGLLDAARAGRLAAGQLVGEPGVGKSRLAEELSARAEAQGFTVLVGRCSRDDGAPPLWPWTAVLDALAAPGGTVAEAAREVRDQLGHDQPDGRDEGGRRFRDWDAVRTLLVAAARERPVLVVLEDLHWADSASLRLLVHLLDRPDPGGLALVGTRRPDGGQGGPLAVATEALARRHAVRIDLTGLSPDDGRRLVEVATGRAVDDEAARALHARTEGNAFFLVELARLPGGEDAVPAAVADVVAARAAHLPDDTQDVLRTACVVGRSFEVAVLAAATGRGEDDVLDALDPALAAGLVLDEGDDTFRFAHALARDALYDRLPPARRARRHAAVAAAIEDARGAGALSTSARHWLAAGPRFADRAWPAAVEAARQALRLHAPEEAAEVLAAAVRAQEADPAASPTARYDLALEWAEACRWAADSEGLDAALLRAVAHAEALGDVERVARAAVGTVDGAIWHPQPIGSVNGPLVDTLRSVLRRLPPADAPLRCRAMLGLAVELYYADADQEREALAEEGLAAARRLGDPDLLVQACTAAFLATWRPDNAGERWSLADEVVRTARARGDAVREALGLTQRAIAAQECGLVTEMWQDVAEARALAERLRLAYPLVVLGWLEVPWLALRGCFAEAHALWETTARLMRRTSMPQRDQSPLGSLLAVALCEGTLGEQLLAEVGGMAASFPFPLTSTVAVLLARAGHLDQARAVVERDGLPIGGSGWFSLFDHALTAEAAWHLGLPDVARAVYPLLAPMAGHVCTAGSGPALGPVDRFLALAAAAAGEPVLAARHADDALALCERWEIPIAGEWMREERTRGGF